MSDPNDLGVMSETHSRMLAEQRPKERSDCEGPETFMEEYHRRLTLAAEKQQLLSASMRAIEHVAWLRYKQHEDGRTTIHICDSDSPGAFKVYR